MLTKNEVRRDRNSNRKSSSQSHSSSSKPQSQTLSARRLLTMYLPQLQTVALRKHGTLRKSCDEYIKKLQSEKKQRSRIQSADSYFEPFRIACQTKHPETVHVSLNGIQNLVAGGYLTGERMVKTIDSQNNEQATPLIDIIVQTVCECVSIPHSSTQLMVINTLLNLCTCGTTEVHGKSLLQVIMSLYYIFLNSRDWDVQTSATATLTQTMSILFARVESVSNELTQLADAYKRRGNQEYSKNHHRTALKYYQKAHELNPRTPIYLVNMGITYYVLNELNESHRLCIEAVKVGKKNGAQIQWIAKAFSTLAHVAYKQQKISACIRYYRLSLNEYNDPKIRRKLNEIIQEFGDATSDKNDIEFWEKVVQHSNYSTPEHTPPAKGNGVMNNQYPNQRRRSLSGYNGGRKTQTQLVQLLNKLHIDCFIVLEELCKLAAKQQVDKSLLQNKEWSSFLFPKNDSDLVNIRSRSLSLRLINSAMNNVGPHLSGTKKFISMIRTNLVPTLCANVTSTIESIIQLSLKCFVTIMKSLVKWQNTQYVQSLNKLLNELLKSSAVYKAFLINNECHIFTIYKHSEQVYHIKVDMTTKNATKINLWCKKNKQNNRLLKVFYVKTLNKLIVVDPDIHFIQETGYYVKSIYCYDLGKDDNKWSTQKLILNNIHNMGYFLCNGCIVCYDTIMILFCNLGIFCIDLERMVAYNMNKQSFGPEFIESLDFDDIAGSKGYDFKQYKEGSHRKHSSFYYQHIGVGDEYNPFETKSNEELRFEDRFGERATPKPHKRFPNKLFPGSIEGVVNENENKKYGFHFGIYKGLRTDFLPFKINIMELIPNDFLVKSKMIISGYCRDIENIMVPLELLDYIQVFYSQFATKNFDYFQFEK